MVSRKALLEKLQESLDLWNSGKELSATERKEVEDGIRQVNATISEVGFCGARSVDHKGVFEAREHECEVFAICCLLHWLLVQQVVVIVNSHAFAFNGNQCVLDYRCSLLLLLTHLLP